MAMSRTVREMLDEEPKINLTPMIDVVFLLLIFFMLMKFKSLEKQLQSYLPKDEGMSISKPEPVQQLRIGIVLVPNSTDKCNLIPNPLIGYFKVIPYQNPKRLMFAQLTQQLIQGFEHIGDKVEIAPEPAVPFEYVALTIDAIWKAQDPKTLPPGVEPKRITFMAPPPSGVPE